MKKILLCLSIFIFSLFVPVFAQEENEELNIKGEEYTSAENFRDFIHSLDFVVNLGPSVYLNVNKDLVSAPSATFYPVSIGVLWPNYTFVAMEPTLSFFTMYYLWYDDMALPAEIENRTALSLNFLLNLPLVFQLYIQNTRVQVMGGVSMLARFGMMASDVQDNDSGYTGSARGDLEKINEWFWDKGRFIYLSTGASVLFNVYNNVKVGPDFKMYIPIVGIMNKESLQGTILSIGFKISL